MAKRIRRRTASLLSMLPESVRDLFPANTDAEMVLRISVACQRRFEEGQACGQSAPAKGQPGKAMVEAPEVDPGYGHTVPPEIVAQQKQAQRQAETLEAYMDFGRMIAQGIDDKVLQDVLHHDEQVAGQIASGHIPSEQIIVGQLERILRARRLIPPPAQEREMEGGQ